MKKQNFLWKLISILVIFLFVFFFARSFSSHQSEREIHEIERKNFPDPSILPLTRFELGRRGWTYLHTMASNFPLRDGETEEGKLILIAQFLTLWGQIYPCSLCGNHFLQMIKEKPPPTNSRAAFEVWLCERHNEVNIRLKKPTFNCLWENIRETYEQIDGCPLE